MCQNCPLWFVFDCFVYCVVPPPCVLTGVSSLSLSPTHTHTHTQNTTAQEVLQTTTQTEREGDGDGSEERFGRMCKEELLEVMDEMKDRVERWGSQSVEERAAEETERTEYNKKKKRNSLHTTQHKTTYKTTNTPSYSITINKNQ